VTGSISVTGSYLITSQSYTGSLIDNVSPSFGGVPVVKHVVAITSASYAALATKDPNTLYVVSGSAITGSGGGATGAGFPYTGSAVITGSLIITGSSYGNVVSGGIASNTASIDLSAGNYFTCSLANQTGGATTHFNILNPLPGTTAVIRVTSKANMTASFSSNVRQTSGSRYQPTAAVSDDIITLVALDNSNVFVTSVRNLLP